MIQEAIRKVVEGQDLSEGEMMQAMAQIMEGRATPAQIGAFLSALRIKGETVEEIAGAARVMRAKSIPLPGRSSAVGRNPRTENANGEEVIDTCGTGGDGKGTFNVSTITAFVVAGAGLKVAKHGNRAASSLCGSADLMEALGVPLDLSPDHVAACMDRVGIGFFYAPMFHQAMRHAVGPRREIGFRTIFNMLGPLTNPAQAGTQLVGVYKEELTETVVRVLRRLGSRSAIVVHAEGGYDEISITGTSKLTRLHADGRISTATVAPEDVGLRRAQPEEIRGGDAAQNAVITLAVLEGKRGARRDMVLLNAAAALVAADRAADLDEGIAMAAESLDTGSARDKLEALVLFARRISRRKAVTV